MKVLMRAVKQHPYDGIDRAVDSTYEADEQYVPTLIAAGAAVPDAQYQTRDMAAGHAAPYETRDVLHVPRGKRARQA